MSIQQWLISHASSARSRRMTAPQCTDPLIGNILAGWRYDISGLSPAMRTDYDQHLSDCAHCRRRQHLARTIDVLLISVIRSPSSPSCWPRQSCTASKPSPTSAAACMATSTTPRSPFRLKRSPSPACSSRSCSGSWSPSRLRFPALVIDAGAAAHPAADPRTHHEERRLKSPYIHRILNPPLNVRFYRCKHHHCHSTQIAIA